MTVALDRSPEAAQDSAQRARLDFLATPCQATAETYRRRSFAFWRARNRTSIGWDLALARLDVEIDRTIRMAEANTHA